MQLLVSSPSEFPQELHQIRIVSPLFLDSAMPSSWIAGGQRLCFYSQVCFRVDIGCVKRNMAQPRPDCVEINAGAKQVGCGRVPNRVWADALGF